MRALHFGQSVARHHCLNLGCVRRFFGCLGSNFGVSQALADKTQLPKEQKYLTHSRSEQESRGESQNPCCDRQAPFVRRFFEAILLIFFSFRLAFAGGNYCYSERYLVGAVFGTGD
jgi:hypothetical protein